MKRVVFGLLAVCVFATGCTGSFMLTRKVYNFHRTMDDKWVDELAFLGCIILPVYGLATLGDAIIFNSIEFWSGENPIEEVKATQPKVYRQWQEQPDTVCPPEGEMLSEGRQRVVTSLEKLLKKHRKGVIAIVLPEPLASVAYGSLTNTELGDLWLAETRCGQWDIVDLETEPALTSTA